MPLDGCDSELHVVSFKLSWESKTEDSTKKRTFMVFKAAHWTTMSTLKHPIEIRSLLNTLSNPTLSTGILGWLLFANLTLGWSFMSRGHSCNKSLTGRKRPCDPCHRQSVIHTGNIRIWVGCKWELSWSHSAVGRIGMIPALQSEARKFPVYYLPNLR